ncbi:hypothetical protein AAFG07_34920 [Bradyrhizobium sp. B097]|uniref:hypothetical protein n=1 Tax=Bradyrhizobium sp. B097 TaxID=3140244 RepID=UPI0031830ED7
MVVINDDLRISRPACMSNSSDPFENRAEQAHDPSSIESVNGGVLSVIEQNQQQHAEPPLRHTRHDQSELEARTRELHPTK